MIITNTENIGKWSNSIIEVVCDDCKVEKRLKYKLYTSYGYEGDEYYCRKCKLKRNNLQKWGVENVFQLDDIKEKIKQKNLQKWGVEYITQSSEIKEKVKSSISKLDKGKMNMKRKSTLINKWGVDNISKVESIKEKKRSTCQKNWGVEFISQSEEFKKESILENLEKWGVDHFFQTTEFKEKSKFTNLQKWGVDNPSKNPEISEKIKSTLTNTLNRKILKREGSFIQIDNLQKIFKIQCYDCQRVFEISYFLFYKRRETHTMICTLCNPIDKHQSGKEILLFNFIKSVYGGEIIQNYKSEKWEIDIFIPELKLGFEFNGIYWHSDLYKSKDQHKKKSDYFSEKGIQIFNIWEDDWDLRGDIIKSQIKNSLGLSEKIWARNCKIIEMEDVKKTKNFLNKNHIQGFVRSNIKIGLIYGDELVSIMTFDKLEGRKKMEDGEWNINRFCNKLGHTVIGGASKILKYFTEKYDPRRIISYSDGDWSRGNLYQKLGFSMVHNTGPDYKYLVGDRRVHKSNFKRSKTGKSEGELEIPKVWDCGKVKWEILYI